MVFEPAELYGKMVLSLRKTLSSRLENHLSKLYILHMVRFVNNYQIVGSSNRYKLGIVLSLIDHEKYGLHLWVPDLYLENKF